MSLLRKYVEELSDVDRISIIKNQDQFEKDGFIGDAPIRTFTRTFINDVIKIPAGDNHIVLWMNMMVLECYRYYALKQIEENAGQYSIFEQFSEFLRGLEFKPTAITNLSPEVFYETGKAIAYSAKKGNDHE